MRTESRGDDLQAQGWCHCKTEYVQCFGVLWQNTYVQQLIVRAVLSPSHIPHGKSNCPIKTVSKTLQACPWVPFPPQAWNIPSCFRNRAL